MSNKLYFATIVYMAQHIRECVLTPEVYDLFKNVFAEGTLHKSFSVLAEMGYGTYAPSINDEGQPQMKFTFEPDKVKPDIAEIAWGFYDPNTDLLDLDEEPLSGTAYLLQITYRRQPLSNPDVKYGSIVHIDYGDITAKGVVVLWDDKSVSYVEIDKLDPSRLPLKKGESETVRVVLDKNDGFLYLNVTEKRMRTASHFGESFHRSQQDAAYRRKGYYLSRAQDSVSERAKAVKAEAADPGSYYVQLKDRASRILVTPLSNTERLLLESLLDS